MQAKFVRSIGRVRCNGFGASLYEKPDGSACIRFDKNTHDLPHKTALQFRNIETAEYWLASVSADNDLQTLVNILRYAGIFKNEGAGHAE